MECFEVYQAKNFLITPRIVKCLETSRKMVFNFRLINKTIMLYSIFQFFELSKIN